MFTKPDPQRLIELHRRLIADDPVAPSEFAELTVEALTEVIRIGNHDLRDANMADEAATDAILDFLKSPKTFDPGQSSIWSFLEMAARRNLSNLVLKESRQHGKGIRYKDVALHDPARKKVQESPLASLTEVEATTTAHEKVDAEVASLSPTEAAVFKLMSDGVRRTADYARALGIADRPAGEQKLAVKQVKDRLMKRMKRSLQEADDE